MNSGRMIRSRFRGVYTALFLLWILGTAGFVVVLNQWIAPALMNGRVTWIETLIRSQQENLLLQNHRVLRDELLARKVILDDRDFEQVWTDQGLSEIQSLLGQSHCVSARACIGKNFAIFLNADRMGDRLDPVSFAIVLKHPSLLGTQTLDFWRIAGPLCLALILGLVLVSIRREEIFLTRKIGILAESYHKVDLLFGGNKTQTWSGGDREKSSAPLDEFAIVSESLDRAAQLLQERTDQIIAYKAAFEERARADQLTLIASQVAHDIRSPLASLNAIVRGAQGLDHQTRLQLRTAAGRISDIANSLLMNHRKQLTLESGLATENAKVTTKELISPLVELAISQKLAQFSERNDVFIDSMTERRFLGLFAEIQPVDFQRVLSNLLNNSIEAMDQGGRIEVSLAAEGGWCRLTLSDTGKGIPAEILSRLGERGITFGKKEGNGLGVSHAKAVIESWGGKFQVESTLGVGTQVSILLPQTSEPVWYASALCIPTGATLVMIDDDPSIHYVWGRRLSDRADVKQVHLHHPKEYLAWYRENYAISPVYILMDQEFAGSAQLGVELIEMTGVAASAVLVTGRWEEESLRRRCERIGLKILPKGFAGMVEVNRGT